MVIIKILETDRLILRTWCEADTPHFIAMNQDPSVMQYFPTLATEEETRALLAKDNPLCRHVLYRLMKESYQARL